ncbi:ROK family protein [Treponema zuelzerae]|uniref:ROK family protein n=1 Tax=Teretinema zuelzerae TaxID=156 RepID=A0AAE3EGY5_9SPIR|nr:ROK family transcriptional regulator [Teretinema zuelzerae]MCD1654301.1 ROK family protein [Teretinema zuelzerae]
MQINNNYQKNANISLIAKMLWKKPGISRVDISRELDLYRSTVSNIINSLIDNGVVLEEKIGDALPQGGRKPIYLGLNPRFGCSGGIEMQPDCYRAVLVSITGDVLESFDGPFPDGAFEDAIDTVCEQLFSRAGVLGIPLLGICVGMPGIIDSEGSRIIRSDPFGIANAPFVSRFSKKRKIPVLVENDANCLAWLELARNREESLSDFMCLTAEYHDRDALTSSRPGMSVGLGLALSGSVYSGAGYAAGEFVSVSWRPGKAGQSGISDELMKNIEKDEQAFSVWAQDLFSSLVPVVSVFNPQAVFAHGELARQKEKVLRIIEERVPQFASLLETVGAGLKFGDGELHSLAEGAALMFFLLLFSVPGGSSASSSRGIDWDAVFEIASRPAE